MILQLAWLALSAPFLALSLLGWRAARRALRAIRSRGLNGDLEATGRERIAHWRFRIGATGAATTAAVISFLRNSPECPPPPDAWNVALGLMALACLYGILIWVDITVLNFWRAERL